ncbi:flagellin FliC, partial [bacterium]|nr:flagellin FliC [bacterium]
MAVVINTNVDSLKIQSLLTNSTNKMSQAMQRMSSGLKILNAKDDAAGTVISAKMQVQLNGNKIAQTNVQNANALLSTAEGNLDVIQDNMTRIRDLTLQAKNGTYSADEIEAMQDEVSQRMKEIDRINQSAEYSSLKLFGGTELANGATFQVGADYGESNTISTDSTLFEAVNFSAMTGVTSTNFNLTGFDKAAKTKFTTAPTGVDDINDCKNDYDVAIKALDAAISKITDKKSEIGSVGNRMDSALATLTTQYENLSSAKSIITDADVAAEASNFTQQQILQQVSTSLLAQANQA